MLAESEEFDYDWVQTLWSHKSVVRYLDVLNAFLDLREPVAVTFVRDALRGGAKPHGYQTHPNEGRVAPATRLILSHEAHKSFPAEWLERTFPGYKSPLAGKFQVWLDGTLWMPIPPTNVAGYALAASLLFPSGDVFIQAVLRQQSRQGVSDASDDDGTPASSVESSTIPVRTLFSEGYRLCPAKDKTPGKRRRWTLQEKAVLVRRTYELGMSVATVAREENVLPRVLYEWRQQEKEGLFAAVTSPSLDLELARAEIARLRFTVQELRVENASLRRTMNLSTQLENVLST